MLFLVDSGGAWNHFAGNDKTKGMEGLFTGSATPTGSHCSALFSLSDARSMLRQGRALIYISNVLDLHGMHAQSFTLISASQMGTFSITDSSKMLSKQTPKNRLKYIRSLTA